MGFTSSVVTLANMHGSSPTWWAEEYTNQVGAGLLVLPPSVIRFAPRVCLSLAADFFVKCSSCSQAPLTTFSSPFRTRKSCKPVVSELYDIYISLWRLLQLSQNGQNDHECYSKGLGPRGLTLGSVVYFHLALCLFWIPSLPPILICSFVMVRRWCLSADLVVRCVAFEGI